MNNQEKLARKYRTAVRKLAGSYRACPVEIIFNSSKKPKVVGSGWHYETRGGRYIDHPNAYAKTGWSNMVYCASTVRVEVGAGFKHESLNKFAEQLAILNLIG